MFRDVHVGIFWGEISRVFFRKIFWLGKINFSHEKKCAGKMCGEFPCKITSLHM